MFGFGQVFSEFFTTFLGPLFYASALLIFISAVIKFLNEHFEKELLLEVKISEQLLPPLV
jgi:hypothetical protein